jgi:CPA1 family monovalent cation:H+ antiporter
MPLLMGWTGMRGVVSLAAALSIPVTLHGAPFPHRNLILFITFMVILLTLLIQGLTLPYFIRRINMMNHTHELPEAEAKLKVKGLLVAETIRLLKITQQKDAYKNNHYLQRITEQWEDKISQPENLKMDDSTKEAYLELLEQQRLFLIELGSKDPEIHDEIIRWQSFQIDLEEERIRLI